jgi:eukaryotic-like serine/threonine-protein kinase
VDQINFASHVTVPVLMLNGRYDYYGSPEAAQIPMFRLFATPEKGKRMIIYESGHLPPRDQIVKETLAWLDRYMGSVVTSGTASK